MQFLYDGPEDGPVFLFAHGAGAPMDSAFMNDVASGLAASGVRVVRFEFPYMAKRRADGKKRGPDRMPVLLQCFEQAMEAHGGAEHVFIGGKSMGGRVATMIGAETSVEGVVVFGYPFHAPGKPEMPRIDHLTAPAARMLILHGTRDPFGKPDEILGYGLPAAVSVQWVEDGEHGFKPRKKSGRTLQDNIDDAVRSASAFIKG